MREEQKASELGMIPWEGNSFCRVLKCLYPYASKWHHGRCTTKVDWLLNVGNPNFTHSYHDIARTGFKLIGHVVVKYLNLWDMGDLWRPLHTWAKSRGHEIVRAQKKVSKGHPTHLRNHVVWSQTLNCNVKSYVIGSSTKCYFNEFVFMQVLIHEKIK